MSERSEHRGIGAEQPAHDPLAVSATDNESGTGNTSPPNVEARVRIRDAAVELFGEHGFSATSVKSIAARAGVSPPLVIHHFGSKANLRKECDRYVAEQFRQRKTEGITYAGLPKQSFFGLMRQSRHLIQYLLRAFLAGGPEMDELFDRLVDDAVEYTNEAEKLGLVTPSANQRSRVALMLMMQFGSLMMTDQMSRYFNFDPLNYGVDDPTEYFAAVMEIFSRPVINAEAFADLIASLQDTDEGDHTAPDTDTDGGPDRPDPT